MFMAGKKGIILGVANHRSIAWGIAKSLRAQGAEVAFSYLNERMKGGVEKLTSEIPDVKLYECDVTKPETIEATFKGLEKDFGKIDFVVHSLAFANKEELDGEFVNTSPEGFALANDISAFSLVTITKAAMPIFNEGASVVALSYLGADKIVTNYNVMGVAKAALEASVRYLANDLGPKGFRVNAISAGPVKTLAAKGISSFSKLLKIHEQMAPLRHNTTIEEVGDTGMFLCSSLSRGITAEVIYVDGGYRQVAVGPLTAYNFDN